jgi:Arm DNA-binding domain
MARGKKPARKIRLTELNVRKAPPKATTYQVWDALQRGLALRVQPTGHKSWMTVYSRQGRGRWLTLGNADAIALADARRLAAEVMVEVARGKDPAAERKVVLDTVHRGAPKSTIGRGSKPLAWWRALRDRAGASCKRRRSCAPM